MNKKSELLTVKNLAVFVVMALTAMFMAVGMASANQPFPLPIRGVYDGTAECTCVVAPFGFNPNLTPINNAGSVSISNRKATFTFEKHGKGSVTAKGSQISLSVPPIPASLTLSFDFTYTATPNRTITFTPTPGTGTATYTAGPNNGAQGYVTVPSFEGTITPDGKMITIFSDASDLGTLSGFGLPPISDNLSCTCIYVLTWQGDEKE